MTTADEMVLLGLRKGPVSSLSDLHGRILALPDGATAALDALAKAGLKQETDYTALPTGDAEEPDEEVLKAILSGKAEAGLVGADAWQNIIEARRVPKGAFDVIWTSGDDA